jgi:hypothetical protein
MEYHSLEKLKTAGKKLQLRICNCGATFLDKVEISEMVLSSCGVEIEDIKKHARTVSDYMHMITTKFLVTIFISRVVEFSMKFDRYSIQNILRKQK